ncbi:uncharacterized protein LOC102678386 [Apis dorsata]|uniref:uncharacterized protein LOC102678386 n=1 Tax=Apis dorsata TaxID=7462 RepID=UPI0003DF51A0|nr:uncharacterized protein LOC102678386 [Apis dorsata]
MEVCDVLRNVIDNEKDLEEKQVPVNEVKDKLKKQIKQLKSLILQIECSLDILKFKNTKCVFRSNLVNNLNTDKIPNVNLQLKSELYRYSGFYCVKFSEDEYIFNFSPLNKYDRKNIFAIQILNNQKKGTLGKWVMPMSIDLNDLTSDFPITELRKIPHFLKICKQHIDSYFIRQTQYTALMDIISHTKNSTLQSNLGYTQISLELMGLYYKNTDSYINIIIYLLYNISEARPHKIEVNSTTQDELDQNVKKHLQKSLVCFKQFDLHKAFENMLNLEAFKWTKENAEDSPLEINNLSNSDEEGFLSTYSITQNRSLIHHKKRRKKRKIKEENFSNILNLHENPIQNKEQMSQNIKQNIDVIKLTPKLINFKEKRLKQTKLKFHLNNLENESSDTIAFKHMQINKKLIKPLTSTPIHQNKHSSDSITSTSISDITITKNNSDIDRK